MSMSPKKLRTIKARVMMLFVDKLGKMIPANSIAEELKDYNISPPQLSQILRTYMIGETYGDYCFVKTRDGYGYIHKKDLDNNSKECWFRNF